MIEKQTVAFHFVSVICFPSLKQNFIAYRNSKVSSRQDCIFEIHMSWQSGFSRVYSNCCCGCSFEAEIIKIGLSSHKMYSNKLSRVYDNLKCLHKKVWNHVIDGPFSWGCKIYWLHLCRRLSLPQQVSCICHSTIWWWGFNNAGTLRSAEYLFISIAFRSTLSWSGNASYGLIYGSNRTIRKYAKVNSLKLTVFTFNCMFKLYLC